VARMGILTEKAKKYISPVLGKYFSDLEIVKGQGVYVFDPDGKRYLDFAAGIGVVSTGHCHPKVVEAIVKQTHELIHIMGGIAYSPPYVNLAELLVSISPFKEASVVLTQSGSEAIEACLKLAKYVSNKRKVVAFSHAFHGRTLGATAVTYKEKYKHGYEDWLLEVVRAPYPYYFHNKDLSFQEYETEIINQVRDIICQDSEIGAVIIEPVLGEGGYVPAPQRFLIELRRITEEHNVLLIFDEVQSGMGRTGKWFASEHYGVVPDIIALAKGIASGMPLGACIAKKEIMDKWSRAAHGGTYIGNPVTCAAALATIDVIKREKLLENSAEVGDYLKEELQKVFAGFPQVGDIRGLGLMIGIEFVNPTTGEGDPVIVSKIRNIALSKGLILISCGDSDQIIRLIPPLIINRFQVDEGVKILLESVQEAIREV
jgi:4-aminobutyrate aminotransferase